MNQIQQIQQACRVCYGRAENKRRWLLRLGKGLGYSPQALRAFMANTYAGRNDRIAERVELAIENLGEEGS